MKDKSDAKPIIEVSDLYQNFGSGEYEVAVLKGIDLQIHAGEYVILFGPSGCGKSTLLNCIAGLEKPSKGKITLRGQDISKLKSNELALMRNRKIGMIFQQFNVIKSLNVLENIALPQLFFGISRKRRLNRAIELLKMFDLEKIANRIPTEVSGGQQQRVAIARALVNNPWILVIDEPTGSLDSKAADDVMDLIFRLNKKSRRTVILVTHNPDYLHFADTIHYMKDGKIIDTKKQKSVIHFDEKDFERVGI